MGLYEDGHKAGEKRRKEGATFPDGAEELFNMNVYDPEYRRGKDDGFRGDNEEAKPSNRCK